MTIETDRSAVAWRRAVDPFQHANKQRSAWQLVNTLIPYLVLWILMYRSLFISYWLTLALSVLAAGFMVRLFVIFHDCAHGSFFASQRANTAVGIFTGIITFTAYYDWRHSHAVHHATAGDLDRRGTGDILTMTVDEYLDAPWWKRLAYRVYRFPPVLLGIGPSFLFLIVQRFPIRVAGQRERNSVLWTDLALLVIVVAAALTIGWQAYVLIQIPIMVIGGAAGVWLFYIQHQFEGVYWERHEKWDFEAAALQGSSFYKLPRILQWFSGNIGFHHIHHLSPRIPNYNLESCYNSSPLFQAVKSITLRSSLKSLNFRLWDERSRRLVGFNAIK